ncbi:MAG: DivIVA domain-containing protein [candidate division Zixibacteria bacterium]|nr:DivIVA domain-containing protein [candidate division Zixibacteria bacterium]
MRKVLIVALNPIDIRHQQFKKALRGFDAVEVEHYLNQVADRMEEVLQEHEELKISQRELKAKLSSYTDTETAISETMVAAQKNAEKTVENANKEAGLIIKQARSDADRIIKQASDRAVKIRQYIHELEMEKTSLVGEIRSIINAHTQLIEQIVRESEKETPEITPRSKISDDDIDKIAEEYEVRSEAENQQD